MEKCYKYDTSNNYMILSEKNINTNSYDVKMITKNIIEGLLPVTISSYNDTTQFYYKITSKQSLENIYLCSKIKGNEILCILKNMICSIKNLEMYLLDINKLLISFENIYVNLADMKTYICYYPVNNQDFYNDFQIFIQRLLTVTDHTDNMATKVIYEVYDICNKKNYLLSDIITYLDNFQEYSDTYSRVCKNDLDKESNFLEEVNICQKSLIKESNVEKPKKIVNRIKGIFGQQQEKPNDNPKLVSNDAIQKVQTLNKPDNTNQDYTNYKLNTTYYDDSTMLLSEGNHCNNYSLIGICGCSNIVLNKFPVVLGKLPDKVDIIVDNKMISRIHAKIINDDGTLFIEDLNSKNGTYVNEHRIEPHELMQIEIGDRIQIANYKYILN